MTRFQGRGTNTRTFNLLSCLDDPERCIVPAEGFTRPIGVHKTAQLIKRVYAGINRGQSPGARESVRTVCGMPCHRSPDHQSVPCARALSGRRRTGINCFATHEAAGGSRGQSPGSCGRAASPRSRSRQSKFHPPARAPSRQRDPTLPIASVTRNLLSRSAQTAWIVRCHHSPTYWESVRPPAACVIVECSSLTAFHHQPPTCHLRLARARSPMGHKASVRTLPADDHQSPVCHLRLARARPPVRPKASVSTPPTGVVATTVGPPVVSFPQRRCNVGGTRTLDCHLLGGASRDLLVAHLMRRLRSANGKMSFCRQTFLKCPAAADRGRKRIGHHAGPLLQTRNHSHIVVSRTHDAHPHKGHTKQCAGPSNRTEHSNTTTLERPRCRAREASRASRASPVPLFPIVTDAGARRASPILLSPNRAFVPDVHTHAKAHDAHDERQYKSRTACCALSVCRLGYCTL